MSKKVYIIKVPSAFSDSKFVWRGIPTYGIIIMKSKIIENIVYK